MKAAPQKNDLLTRLKSLIRKAGDYRVKSRDELLRYVLVIAMSFVAAVIIQEKFVIEHLVGSFLIITFVLFLFFKDIKRYKAIYFNDSKMMLLVSLLIIGTLLLGRFFEFLLYGLHRGLDIAPGTSYFFGIPIPAGAMMITLLFDFHLAISFSFVMSLVAGLWFNDPFYSVYVFIGSLTASFCVLRCKRRSTLIKAGLYVSAVNIVTAAIYLILHGKLLSPMAPPTLLFAALSGLSVTAVVSIVLPSIEYLFGLITDVSLVELLDLDQPLMKALMINAPGTYHHSVIVGNLSEAAAEAVGANPLHARVCSYYHDIGKLRMPEYFVENQATGVNKHDKLAPSMSSMILTSHIKEGLELARQYKLPRPVTDIIQQHHGTSLISFFYQKALEQKADPPPVEENFRYPGPKPQTRVAALVMMADAVEAASRTLIDPTPSRIAAHVEKIINNIYLAGQIDECDLTLRDISEIKRRFTHILTSIFHKRVEYPETILKGLTQKEQKSQAAHGNGNSHKEPSKVDTAGPAEDRPIPQEGDRAGVAEGR